MTLKAIGRLIAQRRRDKGFTLRELAGTARVGRSTLAALESGKLSELGYEKVARICTELDMVLEARPFALQEALIEHRHLTDAAGRDLTKAAIEDIILHGDISAWRGLVRAAREDSTMRIARRVREVVSEADKSDPKIGAFAALLPDLLQVHRNTR